MFPPSMSHNFSPPPRFRQAPNPRFPQACRINSSHTRFPPSMSHNVIPAHVSTKPVAQFHATAKFPPSISHNFVYSSLQPSMSPNPKLLQTYNFIFVTPTTKLSTGACHSSRPSVLFMSEQMNSTLRDFPPLAFLAKMLKGNSQSPPHALCPFAGCSVLGAVAPGTVRMCSSVCKPRHVSVLHERKFCDLAMCANMGSAIAHVVVCVFVRRIRPTAHSCGLVHTLAIGGAVAKVALFLCDFCHIIVQFA